MNLEEMRAALRAAGRTKADRADFIIREQAKVGGHWVLGGPRSWSKDEIDNEVIRMAEATAADAADAAQTTEEPTP